eukprot:g71778.t1
MFNENTATPQLPFSRAGWLACGFLIGIVGIVGDLTGSLVKRSLKRKDTGDLLPGVGGLLDRFDGNSFTFALVFYASVLATQLGRTDPFASHSVRAGLAELVSSPFHCPAVRTSF